ncbi:MAG TPA: hypothetical protein VHS28_00995 [Chloroflexota bacterium]|nr:hypothetical protein [Chloroflexota bacterium]
MEQGLFRFCNSSLKTLEAYSLPSSLSTLLDGCMRLRPEEQERERGRMEAAPMVTSVGWDYC